MMSEIGHPLRLARTTEVMGTVASVHAILAADPWGFEGSGEAGAGQDAVEALFSTRADAAFVELREVERVFSPFLPGSHICRMRDGTLRPADAHPWVAEVREACELAERETNGRFSANWRGWFDPTGYVKGWAVERAFAGHLRALLDAPGLLAVGLNVGGDMQLATVPGADWAWRIGIAHPARTGELLAQVEVLDGAVATSGTAERGAHIVDPRTGELATGALSATVIAPSLAEADVLATAAVVAGAGDLGWIRTAPHTSGLIIAPNGEVRRWVAGVEVVQAEPTFLQ